MTTKPLQGLSLIGQTPAAPSGMLFHAQNPATGEALDPPYHEAGDEDMDRACRLAAEAAPVLARTSGKLRADFLRAIAARLEAIAEAIAARMPQETGLPEARARGELARTCGQLRLFAAVAEEGAWLDARIDHGDPERRPAPKPDIRSMLQPLGPVAVFAASNFPLAFSVAGGDTASAFAAGCPVVVKAHGAHPGLSELVGREIQAAARERGLPEGTFALLFGAGSRLGAALVRHPAIQAVGFTGSIAGGTALMRLAAERPQPIPVYAEMGSVNPVVLLEGALARRGTAIAEGLAASVTLGAGQFCTCPGLVLAVDGPAYRDFRAVLSARLAALPAAPMLSLAMAEHFQNGIAAQQVCPGVEALVRGSAGAGHGAPVLQETSADNLLAQPRLMEEVFGPSTLLVRAESETELVQVLKALPGQLTATVHADEAELAERPALVETLAKMAGRVLFGGFPTGVEVGHAMVHGGPFPATSDGRSTSVGSAAITRFARPVCYQGFPDTLLPETLREGNPLGLMRLVDGERRR
ncbi:MAG: aldehyde dehydrogenase (NADP(+)) [Gammaproteobacteria bacterium]|nr:aldehyde dehydrogenase (NADP(+)) [Gammaproteobacteria bacterium]